MKPKLTEMYEGKCPICGELFKREMKQVRANLKRGAKMITCSQRCAANKGVKFGLKFGERIAKG